MSADRAVDLFIKLELKETFWANLGVIARRLRFVLIPIVLLTPLTGAILIAGRLHPDSYDWQNISSNVAPLFWFSVAYLPFLAIITWLAARMYLRDYRVRDGFQCRISDAGIIYKGFAVSVELSWVAYIMARETKVAFQLYVTRSYFHLLPKRCFASQEDIDLVREIIRAYCPNAKLLS
jgi:YcxB-like protein